MRVVVTRPQPDAEATARELAALGHDAIIAPLLAIVATGAALPEGPFDAIAVTSAHAVAMLAAPLPQRLAMTPLHAVGKRTAAAARARGFTDVNAADGEANALVADIAANRGAGSRILYLAGTERKATLESGLRRAGCRVTVVETYAARPVAALPAVLAAGLAAGDVDAVLHFSHRSAAIFCRMVAEAGLMQRAAQVDHHCISRDAAEPIRAIAPERVVVAAHPDAASLLATVPPAGTAIEQR